MSKVVGTQEVVRRLRHANVAALALVKDSELKDLLRRRVLARFDEGVAPDGSPWAGLMEETIKRKRRAGYPHPDRILYATSRLRGSIKIIQGTNQNILASSTGLGFRVGISNPQTAEYGRLHNYGLGGQEPRRFIGLGALDLVSVQGFLRRRVKSIANA